MSKAFYNKLNIKPNIGVLTIFSIFWHHMLRKIWVNIGSGNGLVPTGNKSLPDPMLTQIFLD